MLLKTVLVGMLGGAACSLAFVPRVPSSRCVEASPWPSVDAALAVGTGVGDYFATTSLLKYLSEHSTGGPGAIFVGLEELLVVVLAGATVPTEFAVSAIVGHARQSACRDAHVMMRANGIDPDAPLPLVDPAGTIDNRGSRAEQLAHEGEQAAERGECSVVVAIAADLRALDAPVVLDAYLRDVGVAACLP